MADHLDVPLDHAGLTDAGSALGAAALQVFDEATCVVGAVLGIRSRAELAEQLAGPARGEAVGRLEHLTE